MRNSSFSGLVYFIVMMSSIIGIFVGIMGIIALIVGAYYPAKCIFAVLVPFYLVLSVTCCGGHRDVDDSDRSFRNGNDFKFLVLCFFGGPIWWVVYVLTYLGYFFGRIYDWAGK